MRLEGERPILDVVVPAYNAEKYIRDTIASVLRHGAIVEKVIVVDDGSEDGTRALVEDEWGLDERVVLLRQENQGVSAARNLGMKAVSSPYCYFMDADDLLLPTFSKALSETLEGCNIWPDAIALAAAQFDDDGSEPVMTPFASVPQMTGVAAGPEYVTCAIEQGIWSPCVWQYIWRRNMLVDAGASFEKGVMHEDDIFCLPTLWQAAEVVTCETPVYAYRRSSASMIGVARGEESIRGCLRAIEVYEKFMEDKGGGMTRRERAAIVARISKLVEISVETSIDMKRECRPGKRLMDLADVHRRRHVSIGQQMRMQWIGLHDVREALLRRLT